MFYCVDCRALYDTITEAVEIAEHSRRCSPIAAEAAALRAVMDYRIMRRAGLNVAPPPPVWGGSM